MAVDSVKETDSEVAFDLSRLWLESIPDNLKQKRKKKNIQEICDLFYTR